MVTESAQSSDVPRPSVLLAEPIKVALHYVNGQVLKGAAHDFHPSKPHFHFFPADAGPSGKPIQVHVKDLKAVVFMKDLVGDDLLDEPQKIVEGKQPPGRKVEVVFADGSVLVGLTMAYDPRRPGFFVVPLDPHSNTSRVFVLSHTVSEVRHP
ncbi:MAG: hypothetical protein WAP47_01730 [Candidatus Rokuibacteriota bacterium]